MRAGPGSAGMDHEAVVGGLGRDAGPAQLGDHRGDAVGLVAPDEAHAARPGWDRRRTRPPRPGSGPCRAGRPGRRRCPRSAAGAGHLGEASRSGGPSAPICSSTPTNARSPWSDPVPSPSTRTRPPVRAAAAKKYEAERGVGLDREARSPGSRRAPPRSRRSPRSVDLGPEGGHDRLGHRHVGPRHQLVGQLDRQPVAIAGRGQQQTGHELAGQRARRGHRLRGQRARRPPPAGGPDGPARPPRRPGGAGRRWPAPSAGPAAAAPRRGGRAPARSPAPAAGSGRRSPTG